MTNHYLCAKQHIANFYSDHKEKKNTGNERHPTVHHCSSRQSHVTVWRKVMTQVPNDGKMLAA